MQGRAHDWHTVESGALVRTTSSSELQPNCAPRIYISELAFWFKRAVSNIAHHTDNLEFGFARKWGIMILPTAVPPAKSGAPWFR